jgi:hypothetical protein
MARTGYPEANCVNDPQTKVVILGLSENAAVTTPGWGAWIISNLVRRLNSGRGGSLPAIEVGVLYIVHLLKVLEDPRSLLTFRFQQDIWQCYSSASCGFDPP